MTGNNFRLITLGRVALVHPDGHEDESLGKRIRKLAVLAFLAVTRRAHTREALTEMFWGEQEDVKARHSLSDVLSNIRRVIQPDCIVAHRADIELSPDTPLTVDANELTDAAAQKKWSKVVELYGGDFLNGVSVPGSGSFENWMSRERARLKQLFITACERRASILEEDSDWESVANVAQRWLEADPLSATAAIALLNARRAQGTLDALRTARREYEQLVGTLLRDYEADVDSRVSTLAAEIAREEDARAPRGIRRIAAFKPQRRRVVGIAVGIVALASALWATSWKGSPKADRRAIAIVDIQNLRGDSVDEWLEQGLPQMIAADLSNAVGAEIVAPERVRQVRARAVGSDDKPLNLDQIMTIAKGVDAGSIITGGFTHGGGRYVLDLTVHSARTGEVIKLFTVSDTSVIGVADAAAARLAGVARIQSGPQFAEIETPSIDAYRHYIRAMQEFELGKAQTGLRELDAAIAVDSGFVAALRTRIQWAQDDTALTRRLYSSISRHPERGSEYDRLMAEVSRASLAMERSRVLALGREIATRYAHDPTAVRYYGDLLAEQGFFDHADSVYRRALAIDSLGMEVGIGPCAPCQGYGGLINLAIFRGDIPTAERLARRWLELQPDAQPAWGLLGDALRYQQRFSEAMQAYQRSESLGDAPKSTDYLVGFFLEARQLGKVDSLMQLLKAQEGINSESYRNAELLLARERGQFRRSSFVRPDAGDAERYETANSLARIGQFDASRALYEKTAHNNNPVVAGGWPRNNRLFCWAHAQEADALSLSGDTVFLRVLADSIALVSPRSPYGRDRRLHHHVLGLIAMLRGDYPNALAHFQNARWGGAGWTVTVAAMGRAYMKIGKPREAVRILRDGYKGPLDAMGRYEPKSEIDFLMALAFQQAGERDSAAVYGNYVRRAWSNADPGVKRQLALLHN